MEVCFTVSARPLAAARGMYRVSFAAALVFALLAVLGLESIGSGFFVFTMVALWFLGVGCLQARQARRLKSSVILIDADGLLASISGREQFHPASEVCAGHGSIARSAGFGKQYRICRAVRICQRIVVADIETPVRSRLPEQHVFSGEVFPLDAAEYDRLLANLKERGWDRPCMERPETPERGRISVLRAVYASGVVLCILAWILLDNTRLALAFLLGGLGLAGLLVNSLYTRNGPSEPGEERMS